MVRLPLVPPPVVPALTAVTSRVPITSQVTVPSPEMMRMALPAEQVPVTRR